MFTKVNHVVILKGRKTDYKYPYWGKGFHSVIFVLDEGNWPGSMLVSRTANLPKCATRLCLSTAKFFRAAGDFHTI